MKNELKNVNIDDEKKEEIIYLYEDKLQTYYDEQKESGLDAKTVYANLRQINADVAVSIIDEQYADLAQYYADSTTMLHDFIINEQSIYRFQDFIDEYQSIFTDETYNESQTIDGITYEPEDRRAMALGKTFTNYLRHSDQTDLGDGEYMPIDSSFTVYDENNVQIGSYALAFYLIDFQIPYNDIMEETANKIKFKVELIDTVHTSSNNKPFRAFVRGNDTNTTSFQEDKIFSVTIPHSSLFEKKMLEKKFEGYSFHLGNETSFLDLYD
jgi:hypothetical protein